MGIHDKYGKDVLRRAFQDYDDNPDPVSFGERAGSLKIDGTIGEDIAVEVESRTPKQVRGAIIDIICHPFPKKLIVIIKKHGNSYTENQCRALLKRFAPAAKNCVVSLHGNGSRLQIDEDIEVLRKAVENLRKD